MPCFLVQYLIQMKKNCADSASIESLQKFLIFEFRDSFEKLCQSINNEFVVFVFDIQDKTQCFWYTFIILQMTPCINLS